MSYFKQYTLEENMFKNCQYPNPSCLSREFHYRENEMVTIASYIYQSSMEQYLTMQ